MPHCAWILNLKNLNDKTVEIVSLILHVISLPFLLWSYFNCRTTLSSGLNINAKILEGKHSYAAIEKEED